MRAGFTTISQLKRLSRRVLQNKFLLLVYFRPNYENCSELPVTQWIGCVNMTTFSRNVYGYRGTVIGLTQSAPDDYIAWRDFRSRQKIVESEVCLVTGRECFVAARIFGLVLLLSAIRAESLLRRNGSQSGRHTLAAAKKENVVTVITDVTASMRDALTMSFQVQVRSSSRLVRRLGPRDPAPSARRTKSRTLSLGCFRPWHDHRPRIDDSGGSLRSPGAGADLPGH